MKPWQAEYPKGISWEFEPVNKPVYDIFASTASKVPNSLCLDFMGKKYTYAQVLKLIEKTALGLQQNGVKKGDRVGLCLPNTPYSVICYYAALKAGAIVVNFNPLYTNKELIYQINDSGTTVMITVDIKLIYNKVNIALADTTLEKLVVCSFANALPSLKKILFKVFNFFTIASVQPSSKCIMYTDLITSGGKFISPTINPSKDIALLQYTGGTTGRPKGAMLTHLNISSNTEQIYLYMGSVSSGTERFIAVLPFFHVFAMTAVMNVGIRVGGEIILIPRFKLIDLLKTIKRTKPTVMHGVPTIFSAISNYSNIAKFDLSTLRYCICGGAPLSFEVRQEFEDISKCFLGEGYGLSETSPVVTCNILAAARSGSVGLPLPGTDIEIHNSNNPKEILKTGETGEIVIKAPQVMKGYWNKPKETKDAFIDGWFRTGDVGYMDKDGYIFITDRIKDIIISSGYNVYPRIIEDAFYEHELVEEVIVIGIFHPKKGEAAKAFVKLKQGASITENELLNFVSNHLNPIEKPVAIEFRDKLPKTIIGKLSKKELIAEEKNIKGKNT